MNANLNSGWGSIEAAVAASIKKTTGKLFVVADSNEAGYDRLQELFRYHADSEGTLRFFETIDAAVSACTANRNDVVLVAPGHAETVTAAGGIALDVAGVKLVGVGTGTDRPTITFATNASASITVSAANCGVYGGFIFIGNVASQNHMFDITGTNFELNGLGEDGSQNIEFREGSSTGLAFVVADTADNDSDYLKVRGCRFYAPTAGNFDAAIQLGADFLGVRIEDCHINGDFDNGGIEIPTGGNAQRDIAIRRCTIINLLAAAEAIDVEGTGNTGVIEDCKLGTDAQGTAIDTGGLRLYNVYWTDTGDQTVSVPVFVSPDSTANILGADDSDNLFASTNVVVNGDGSVLERLEYIQDAALVPGVDGTANTQSNEVVGNKTDAAIADTIEGAAATTQSLVADVKAVLQRVGADSANNTAATTLVAANRDGSVLERLEAIYAAQADDVAANLIGFNDSNNVADTSSVAADRDGSVLERLEQLEATVQKTISKVQTTPSGGADALFTITGGPIHVVSIWGIVTTVLVNAANGTLQATTTTPASTTAMSTTVAIDNDAAGTTYTFVGPTGVLTPTTAGLVLIDMGSTTLTETQYIVPIGNINFLTSAAMTGAITWYMSYIPSPGAVVVAA